MDRQPGRGTKQCSRLKISETILRTGQLDAMKAWYRKVLEVDPFFEHAPDSGTRAGDFGGQTRATDLHMCFFRLSDEYPWTQVIGIFEEPGVTGTVPKSTPGLHHMQLMMDDVPTLIGKYEDMAKLGFRPHRSANHGPMTSFYYRDPDGNNVELTAQNFPTFEAMAAFMRSPEFKANPSGVELDPGDFVKKFRGGVPVAELTRIG